MHIMCVMHVCDVLQVPLLPGAERRADVLFKVPRGQVLLQGLPEEALDQRAQAALHCISLLIHDDHSSREVHGVIGWTRWW